MLEPEKPEDPTGGAKSDKEAQTSQLKPGTKTDGQEGTTTSDDEAEK